MDKLEELVRRWRDTAMNHSAENPYTAGEQIGLLGCAEDLSALRRDYVLVPREPSEADVRRAAVKVLEAWDELGAPNAYVAISIAHNAMIGAHAGE